jgi:hypothetical protein
MTKRYVVITAVTFTDLDDARRLAATYAESGTGVQVLTFDGDDLVAIEPPAEDRLVELLAHVGTAEPSAGWQDRVHLTIERSWLITATKQAITELLYELDSLKATPATCLAIQNRIREILRTADNPEPEVVVVLLPYVPGPNPRIRVQALGVEIEV